MMNHSPSNERTKRRYFTFLREAKRQSEASVDAAAMSIARFESATGYRDFKRFHVEQAIAFKRRLGEDRERGSRAPLSKATVHATLGHLKRFFVWLAGQPGYRSRLRYSDAEYFNQSEKDARIATARRDRPYPTLEQVRRVLETMPANTELQRRNRALVAFTTLTGARDAAIASMRLKHVDMAAGLVNQDARQVNTKGSKTFPTYFFPVGEDIRAIVQDWILYLREQKLWGDDDPLFPATRTEVGVDRQFEAAGLKREHWQTAAPIRVIFREAFAAAGLPYFNPHSVRKTLVALAQVRCQTPEEFKAWSQNLGHEGVLTTFYSYGAVAPVRQGEILGTLHASIDQPPVSPRDFAKEVARELANLNVSNEASR